MGMYLDRTRSYAHLFDVYQHSTTRHVQLSMPRSRDVRSGRDVAGCANRQTDGWTQGDMATRNPQRIELGETLRNLRTRAEKKPAEVEQDLRWYAGKVSRVESGARVPTFAEMDRLATIYGIDDEERRTLHLLADAARKRESAARVADFAQTYVTLLRQASVVQYYDAELLPSFLQTKAYARAVLEHGSGTVEDRLTDRLSRGKIVTRETPPLIRVVLGEAMLHRAVGGPDVMREQIAHLLDMAQLPNVAIRILPFAVGAHRALGVGFTVLEIASPKITRVYIEGLTDATYIHEPDETETYRRGFEELWELAAADEESATILRRHNTTEEHDGGETLEEVDAN
ncbi:transcriptional regulator with XRE-family HTH domain [Kibdelosporangium banguiense]|uniref:Transcriptional regulator with XRE-family HTH domain n=1 Tax=Kibdelosporangium banguiense TaxID=1365924 RepID=A0ABS4TH32_9PSEU|nr:helix-turn-helix transcriptional regulator [Kibdelosporangium banguiense]MBP2323740.1 transcriptional regulator with XRE-family HTH domain [Kibdelosporangium banguiense]